MSKHNCAECPKRDNCDLRATMENTPGIDSHKILSDYVRSEYDSIKQVVTIASMQMMMADRMKQPTITIPLGPATRLVAAALYGLDLHKAMDEADAMVANLQSKPPATDGKKDVKAKKDKPEGASQG